MKIIHIHDYGSLLYETSSTGLNEFHAETKNKVAVCNKKTPLSLFIVAILTRLALQR